MEMHACRIALVESICSTVMLYYEMLVKMFKTSLLALKCLVCDAACSEWQTGVQRNTGAQCLSSTYYQPQLYTHTHTHTHTHTYTHTASRKQHDGGTLATHWHTIYGAHIH